MKSRSLQRLRRGWTTCSYRRWSSNGSPHGRKVTPSIPAQSRTMKNPKRRICGEQMIPCMKNTVKIGSGFPSPRVILTPPWRCHGGNFRKGTPGRIPVRDSGTETPESGTDLPNKVRAARHCQPHQKLGFFPARHSPFLKMSSHLGSKTPYFFQGLV